jgi:hypothetical protein
MVGRLFRVVALLLFCLAPAAAEAGLTLSVDLSSQSMTVAEDGAVTRRWAISSGRMGYRTPNGVYRPQRLARMHYSRKYGMSPMPHSIFFRGGYAIHGTSELGHLGRTASHGCIRLDPGNAAELYAMVQEYGRGATRIVITGSAAQADGAVTRPERRARSLTDSFARPRWEPQPIRRRIAPPRRFDEGFEDEPYPTVFPRWLFD